MKSTFLTLCIFFCCIAAQAQTNNTKTAAKQKTAATQTVETACGECQFHMQGKGCQLAVRINGKPYFVDGTSIDEHGDAHGDDGFCNTIRKAEVTGTVVNERYVVTSYKLLPVEKKKQ